MKDPLENPKHEIYAIECAAGFDQDHAYAIADLAPAPEDQRELPAEQHHSPITRKSIRTIESRITLLSAIQDVAGDLAVGGPASPLSA